MGHHQRGDASIPIASLWTRSRNVIRAIRCHTRRCHWFGDLFQRGAVHSARHAVVRRLFFTFAVMMVLSSSARATTKGLSQIVTPDLQGPGDLSLSFQAQSERIANPYDLNQTWRVQVDFQSGKENSSTIGFTCNITRDFQMNPALYVNNGSGHDLFGYVVFTYTFHLWNKTRGKELEKSEK